MAFLYFSLDGMITSDDREIILEINRGTDSGDHCYRAVTGRSMMDVMMWQLREQQWFDRIWFLQDTMDYKHNFRNGEVPHYHRALQASGQHALPGIFNQCNLGGLDQNDYNLNHALWDQEKKHLIFPQDSMPDYYYRDKKANERITCVDQPNIDLEACEDIIQETGNPNITIADSPAAFFELDKNKAFFTRAVQHSETDPAFFPDQEVETIDSNGADIDICAERILSRFADHRRIIIKDTGLLQGKNSYFIDTPDFLNVRAALVKWLDNRPDFSGHERPERLEMVVQEHIPIDPLSPKECFDRARNQAISLWHNPASRDETKRHHSFRLFASYHNGNIMFHDAVYNFANEAHNKSGQNKFITDHNFSAPIPLARKQGMFQRLEKPLLTLLDYASKMPFELTPKEPAPYISPVQIAEMMGGF